MIRCNLYWLMETKEILISDVERDTGIHRNTIRALINDTAKRVDIDVIDKLCDYFDCEVGQLFEKIK